MDNTHDTAVGVHRTGSVYSYVLAAREVLRKEGLGETVMRALHKTIGRYFWIERVAFYDADLTQPQTLLSPLAVEVTFHIATPHQLLNRHRATLEADFHLSNDEVENRLARSHSALLAFHENKLIAMVWLSFKSQKVGEVGKTLCLHASEFLTYDEFTLPEWRGFGISPHLNQFANKYARRHNAARRINWRRLANKPALRVATKLGDRLLSSVTTVRAFGKSNKLVFGLNSAALPSFIQDDSWETVVLKRPAPSRACDTRSSIMQKSVFYKTPLHTTLIIASLTAVLGVTDVNAATSDEPLSTPLRVTDLSLLDR